MLDFLQHATLVIGVLDLLHLDNLLLLQYLDGIEALVVLGLNQVHASETASSQSAVDGKVLQCVLALCLAHGVGDSLWLLDGTVGHVCRVVGIFRLCGGLVDEVLDASSILLRLLLLGWLLRLLVWLRLLVRLLGLCLLLLDWV